MHNSLDYVLSAVNIVLQAHACAGKQMPFLKPAYLADPSHQPILWVQEVPEHLGFRLCLDHL